MSNILVAYFSASGTTEKVAQKLASQIHADLFKIQPKQAYTRADLNWNDSHSRSTLEMKDPNSRPEILNKVEKMEQYNTVFVGFPIWWYREPSIIDTFIESYDLTNKTIIPFATSGGSGMGNTTQELKVSCGNAKICQGRRFDSQVDVDTLKTWAESFL